MKNFNDERNGLKLQDTKLYYALEIEGQLKQRDIEKDSLSSALVK